MPDSRNHLEKYIALAERCGAEVGRYEGEIVWMKFHRSSSVEAFVTGVTMLSAVANHRAAQPTEPDGWKLVPIEPTPAMLHALWQHRDAMRGQSENKIARAAYTAMLAATPSPTDKRKP